MSLVWELLVDLRMLLMELSGGKNNSLRSTWCVAPVILTCITCIIVDLISLNLSVEFSRYDES